MSPLGDAVDRCDCGKRLRTREERGTGMCQSCMSDAMDARCTCGAALDSRSERHAGRCMECLADDEVDRAIAQRRDGR